MKKKIIVLLIFISTIFAFPKQIYASEILNYNNVYLTNNYKLLDNSDLTFDANRYDGDFSTTCRDFAPGLRIIGKIILIVKIALPLIIIAKSTIDLLGVVTKGDPSELKKRATKTGISLFAAIMVFLTPTLLNAIFGLVGSATTKDTSNADSEICRACLFEPNSNLCTGATNDTVRNTNNNRIDLEQ